MEEKYRIVRSKCMANALVWLGYEYTFNEEDKTYIFERSSSFDMTFKSLHCLKSDSERWKTYDNKMV